MRISLSFIVALLLGICAFAHSAARPIAAVREVSGKVKLVRAEAKDNSFASPGALLYPGDGMNTGEKSAAAILFVDGSLLKIQENSSITLTADRTKSGALDTKVKLPLGKIWAKVTRRDAKFEVETPSSVASVKGTELSVLVDDFGVTWLFVFQGIVDFSNELGQVTVRQNEKSEAKPDNPPSAPKRMSSKERKQREPHTGTSWQLDLGKPATPPATGESYRLPIRALNMSTGNVDPQCQTNIVLASNSEKHQFSLYGVEWSPQLEAEMTGGRINLYGKCDEPGQVEVSVQGGDCRPDKEDIEIAEGQPESDWESEAIFTILRNIGVTEAENMGYVGGQITTGETSFEQTLRQLISGGMIVEGFEIVEMPGGFKRVVLRVKTQ